MKIFWMRYGADMIVIQTDGWKDGMTDGWTDRQTDEGHSYNPLSASRGGGVQYSIIIAH